MPLRQRLETVPETVQEFEFSSRERVQEGEALIALGYAGAGIYLLGYSAEMLLKTAYFRFTGAVWSDRIQPGLGPALTAARSLIPYPLPHESYHSLRFWSLLLRKTRSHRYKALPPLLDARRHRPAFAEFCKIAIKLCRPCWMHNLFHEPGACIRAAGLACAIAVIKPPVGRRQQSKQM